jgi:metallo-beta-lactamase family protein
MKIGFFGATGTVTGSKYRVQSGAGAILVDCGLFQGYKQLRLRNWAALPFDVHALHAVVLTHAHLDHSGYLPLLVKNGFDGPVYCTAATADLCRVLLPDAGRLQEEDAERANRHAYSRHAPALPLYTEADALRALENLEIQPWEQDFIPAPGLTARLYPAGHILGSAMVHLRDDSSSVLFTGDLGRPVDPIMRPPAAPPDADYIVMESTYGDRRHPAADPIAQLGEVISQVVARSGVVMIPAFAVGRTQSLLWGLHQLRSQGTLPAQVPVFLNSPMATDATNIYRRHRVEHRLSVDECAAMCHAAKIINTVDESRALNLRKGPMVIIAGSGMATGGRIVHHLVAFAPDARNAIVLAGFQAGGTRGAALLAGNDSIKIHGAYVAVRAQVFALSNLSAHADYAEMLDWLAAVKRKPKGVFMVHGEAAAADAMRVRVADRFGWDCKVPEYGEQVELNA